MSEDKLAAQPVGLECTEQMVQRLGLTAPRVTPADIESAIVEVHYLNAHNSVVAEQDRSGKSELNGPHPSLSLLTLCLLVTRNGYVVVGKSACASPENYNRELGEKIALDDAKRQLWSLLGYALRDRLANEVKS